MQMSPLPTRLPRIRCRGRVGLGMTMEGKASSIALGLARAAARLLCRLARDPRPLLQRGGRSSGSRSFTMPERWAKNPRNSSIAAHVPRFYRFLLDCYVRGRQHRGKSSSIRHRTIQISRLFNLLLYFSRLFSCCLSQKRPLLAPTPLDTCLQAAALLTMIMFP